jgi:hypothetical protein
MDIVKFVIPSLIIVDIDWELKILIMEPSNSSEVEFYQAVDMSYRFKFPFRFFNFQINIPLQLSLVEKIKEEEYHKELDLDNGVYKWYKWSEIEGDYIFTHSEQIECISKIIKAKKEEKLFNTDVLKGLLIEKTESSCFIQIIESPLKGNYYTMKEDYLVKIEKYETSRKEYFIP